MQVCDFNLSEILRKQPTTAEEGPAVTNPMWLAPEVLAGQRATSAVDTYAFGLVSTGGVCMAVHSTVLYFSWAAVALAHPLCF